MATMRRRNLVSSRRRVEDEGDEDEEPLGAGDDSASEVSVLTDAEDNLDVDDSELSDNGAASSPEVSSRQPVADVHVAHAIEKIQEEMPGNSESRQQLLEGSPRPAFPNTADTDAMMHGLKPVEAMEDENEIAFDDAVSLSTPGPSISGAVREQKDAGNTKRESMVQRRIRESQEYNAKRESDPAFVPTRGGFFMHDHRNDTFAQSTSLPSGRGRGRGREIMANAQPQYKPGAQLADATKSRWDHDLHDAITNVKPVVEHRPQARQETVPERYQAPRNAALITSPSKSIPLGVVMVKVSLPSANVPAKTLKMAVHQHTRLPDLRPPLRRDKPVRVSIPDSGPRYIFPSIERSFVFIPRAQRPNQQANKTKNRPFGNQSGSRRTSAYGDNGYEPSISMSRRSSVIRDGFGPSQAPLVARQTQGVAGVPARPVVKLPSGSVQEANAPDASAPVVSSTPNQPYDLPSQPTYRENPVSQLTMHQPRPQKTVSVATIESPSNVPLHAPQQQAQQPFHHQVPSHMNGQMSSDVLSGTVGLHLSMGAQGVRSTSTSNIPEGAINAQPFQPSALTPQTLYTTSYPTQPMFYYPAQPEIPSDQYSADQMASPVYLHQGPYLVPIFVPPALPSEEPGASAQLGTYAQERNGMVYYFDSTQMMGGGDEVTPAGFTMPGAGNLLPSGPDSYYYSQTATNVVYYPP